MTKTTREKEHNAHGAILFVAILISIILSSMITIIIININNNLITDEDKCVCQGDFYSHHYQCLNITGNCQCEIQQNTTTLSCEKKSK